MPDGPVFNMDHYYRPGGFGGQIFCAAAHPTRPDVWCRRMPHQKGDHSAFVHAISTPQSWPA